MPLWKSMDKSPFLSTMQQSNTLWSIFRIWPQNNWNALSELTSSHNSTLHGQYWIFHIMKTRDFWSCMHSSNQRFLILHAQLKPEISDLACTTQTRDFWSCMHNSNQRFLILHARTTQTRDFWSAKFSTQKWSPKLQKGCLRASEAVPRKPDVEKLTGMCSSLVEVICCCCYFLSFSDMHCHTWRKGVSS